MRIFKPPRSYFKHGIFSHDGLGNLMGDCTRARYIWNRSFERYKARDDAYGDTGGLITGEIGRTEGVRFIESPHPLSCLCEACLTDKESRN